ncbi:MAG: hypothetical protein WBO57_06895 [Gammaproteobacteria bacterium]
MFKVFTIQHPYNNILPDCFATKDLCGSRESDPIRAAIEYTVPIGGEVMKMITVFISLLVPVSAIAQNYQGMSESDMQNMMQQMQAMQTCMQGIDQSRLQEFEQRANTLEAEVKSLCASGNRDGAQQKAVAFAQEVTGNPDIQKMRTCTDKMKDMLPVMPYMNHANGPDTSAGHVCDQ